MEMGKKIAVGILTLASAVCIGVGKNNMPNQTVSADLPLFSVSKNNSNVSFGTYEAREHDSSLTGATGSVTGAVVGLGVGDELKYNKVIDVSEATKEDILTRVVITPNQLGVADFTMLEVVLTDAYDAGNYIVMTASGIGEDWGTAYAQGGASCCDVRGGWEHNASNWQTGTYGYPFRAVFSGKVVQYSTFFGGDIANNNVAFSLDYATKQVHHLERTNSLNTMVCDLDNSQDFPKIWKGFTTGECFLSVRAKNYVGSTANFVVTSVFGEPVTSIGEFEVCNPKIEYNFLTYEKENIPFGVVNKAYTLFDAKGVSPYFNTLPATNKVYFDYTGAKEEVAINDGKFMPTKAGVYTVVTNAQDPFGKEGTDNYTITVKSTATPIEVEPVSSTTVTGTAGLLVELPEILATGGSGDLHLTYEVSIGNESVEVFNEQFRPLKAGEYKVVIASITGNVISAQAIGTTKLTVSYTTAKGTTVQDELYVTVLKTTIEEEERNLGVNSANDISDLLEGEEVIDVAIDGAPVEYTVTNSKIKFDSEIAVGKTVAVVIETQSKIYTFNAYTYDYLIGTAQDLTDFGVALKTKKGLQVALTANIDYQNQNFTSTYNVSYPDSAIFTGLIEGNGYTISNVKCERGLFGWMSGATIRNLGLVNVTHSGAGGIFAWESGKNTYENVFVVGAIGRIDENCNGFAGCCDEDSMKNIVAFVNFTGGTKKANAIGSFGSPAKAEDVYAVTSGSNGTMYGSVTDGLYTSLEAWKADSQTLANNFSEEYWTIENGMLVFKSAIQAINALAPMRDSVSITNEETSVIMGEDLTLTSDTDVAYTLKTETTGVSIDGNVLTVGANATANTVTVVATWKHPFFLVTRTAEKTFDLIKTTVVNETNTIIIASNRGVENLVYNTSTGIDTITGITFADKAISEYTFEGGVLTIANAKLAKTGATLTINAKKGADLYVIKVPVEVADYAVGTAAEWDAAWDAITAITTTAYTKDYGMRLILTADIDYQGNVFNSESVRPQLTFTGSEIDGRGYVVKNLVSEYPYGVIWAAERSQIKNIGFINVTYCGDRGFIDRSGNANFENVYIQGTYAYTNAHGERVGALSRYGYSITGNNVVMDVKVTNGDGNAFAFVGYDGEALTNVYVTTEGTNGRATYYDTNKTLYANETKLQENATTIATALNNALWTVKDGNLCFGVNQHVVGSAN